MICDDSKRLFQQRIPDNYDNYKIFKEINAAYWRERGIIGTLSKLLRVKNLFGMRCMKVLVAVALH